MMKFIAPTFLSIILICGSFVNDKHKLSFHLPVVHFMYNSDKYLIPETSDENFEHPDSVFAYLGAVIQHNPNWILNIMSYCDYNEKTQEELCRKRAIKVKNRLIELGADSSNLVYSLKLTEWTRFNKQEIDSIQRKHGKKAAYSARLQNCRVMFSILGSVK